MEPTYHFHLIINDPRRNEGSTNPTSETNLLDERMDKERNSCQGNSSQTIETIHIVDPLIRSFDAPHGFLSSPQPRIIASIFIPHTLPYTHETRGRENREKGREGNREEHEEQAREPIRLSALSPAFNQRLC